MYIPKHFRISDINTLADFIHAYPLGLLINHTQQGLYASNLPFLFYPNEGDSGSLHAHKARANPHGDDLPHQSECLVIFQGPQGYISPENYPSKQAHQRVVPTWNYSLVQCRGVLEIIDDPLWIRQQITELSHQQEASRIKPWAITDAPADYIALQIKGIVGLKITLSEIIGKFKLSQNRGAEDRAGVMAGLKNPIDTHYHPTLAALMEETLKNSD